MPPGFHSAARWSDLCCEGIWKLIVRGLHECGAPCNWMAEGECYRCVVGGGRRMGWWMRERFIVFWEWWMEVGETAVGGCWFERQEAEHIEMERYS